jgi:hypothetical protein
LDNLEGQRRWLAAGFGCALLLTSLLAFHGAWWMMGPNSHLEATRMRQINRQLADFVEQRASPQKAQFIVFPVTTQFVNGDSLKFELYKRRVTNVSTLAHVFLVPDVAATISAADYLVVFDEDEPTILRWLPRVDQYGQLRKQLIADPRFEKVFEIPAADDQHKISIYARK